MRSTVKKTFEVAKDTGNFLIAQVKGNQPTLHDAFQALCASSSPADRAETIDKHAHGRQEHRLVETFDIPAETLDADWDSLIVTVVRVSRLTWHKDTKSGFWHKTDEISLYASQICLSAAEAAQAIRGHWGIENRNHHVRDVTLREDHSRIRKKPAHFARFRTFALNIMRANGADNISRELYINALNPLHAMGYAVS